MLTINGKRYARTDAEFQASLFNSAGTCAGFYTVLKNAVLLEDMQRNVFAAIVVNNGFSGIVSAMRLDGKIYYFYGCSEPTERIIRVPERFSEREDYAIGLFNKAKRKEVTA